MYIDYVYVLGAMYKLIVYMCVIYMYIDCVYVCHIHIYLLFIWELCTCILIVFIGATFMYV